MSFPVPQLLELSAAMPAGDGSTRRWFTSAQMDLIVWTDMNGDLTGFQLCYDKLRTEHSLTWRHGKGFSHQAVDAGDRECLGHKGTPLLKADGSHPADVARLRRELAQAGNHLPTDLRRRVDARLHHYPDPT